MLAVLATDVEEPRYTALIRTLCATHKVHLLVTGNRDDVGSLAGLVKYDDKGTVRKVVRTGVVVLRRWPPHVGEATRALKAHLAAQKHQEADTD